MQKYELDLTRLSQTYKSEATPRPDTEELQDEHVQQPHAHPNAQAMEHLAQLIGKPLEQHFNDHFLFR
jgi:hypothetical protein